MVRKALKKVSTGQYQYTICGTVYEFDRMLRSETGEKTHWNIKIEGGQYFDGAQTLDECIQLAEATSQADLPVCSKCKRHTDDLSLEPSCSQLLFGGFNGRMEYRCAECERKVVRWVERMLAEATS